MLNFGRRLRVEQLEPKRALTATTLAEIAAIGVDPEVIELFSNQNGDFVGDIGPNDPGSPDVPFTDLVLNEPTLRNVVDAIAATEAVPADAVELTSVSQFVGPTSQITSGTVNSPNRYVLRGDFTLADNQTIVLPSNVEVYVDGSIFKRGSFTSPAANVGGNNVDSIFDVNGTSNIRLVGVNDALLHSNPSFLPTDPHTSALIVTGGSADNIIFEGFRTQFLWNAVNAQFGTSNVVIRDNLITDSINRSIWFLGASESAVHHNFISNAGLDTIDYDAFTADSVAYENVLIGAERFTFFVEEAANNNFSVRQLSIIHRFDESPRPGSFQLGNAANGTSPEFVANNPGEATRDNFFLDNATYAPSTQQFRGQFIATGDNGIVGNTYFFGNRGFSSGPGSEAPPFGRNNTVRALYGDRLPSEEILAARDFRFDAPLGFRSYDLLAELEGLDARFNEVSVPVRPEILPLPAIPLTVYQEAGGVVAIEAENYSSQTFGSGSADGQFFGLLIDDDQGGTETAPGLSAVGAQGVIFERNVGTNTGNALNGPRLDYEIDFATPGTYNVYLRTRSTDANGSEEPNFNDSVHVGLNGVSVTNGSGFGVGTTSPTWVFANDVLNGVQDITITVTEAGRHTLNLWGREDGSEVDRIVLTTSPAAPTGFGPAESATLTVSPLAGDYDLDLDVDGDDFDIWQGSFGSTISPWADGNNDGIVNSADYAVWRTNLGASLPEAVATGALASEPASVVSPEPASTDLALAPVSVTPELTLVQGTATPEAPSDNTGAIDQALALLLAADSGPEGSAEESEAIGVTQEANDEAFSLDEELTLGDSLV